MPLQRIGGLAREPHKIGPLIGGGWWTGFVIQYAECPDVGAVGDREGCADIVANLHLTCDRRKSAEHGVGCRVADFEQTRPVQNVVAETVFPRQARQSQAFTCFYPELILANNI